MLGLFTVIVAVGTGGGGRGGGGAALRTLARTHICIYERTNASVLSKLGAFVNVITTVILWK